MKIGNRFFDTKNHTYIMGILNVTPDSFSDGGKWNHMDEALKHTEAMIADGADIIDIGGESTRPGHTPVSADEEAQRVLPVIEAVKKHFDIPVSVDTFKSSVAESSIQAGADLVNDIWGLKYDPKMAAVIAKYDVACCLMHNKSNTEYQNFLIDMLAETQECVNLARQAGIKDEKIMLDPGIGFGKTFEMNLEAITLPAPAARRLLTTANRRWSPPRAIKSSTTTALPPARGSSRTAAAPSSCPVSPTR